MRSSILAFLAPEKSYAMSIGKSAGVSMAPHAPYTVGIATPGKDTGSTQMFFSLGDNTRLDGAYTVFAQVIYGRDVVDLLELGDKVIKATVQPFRGF